MGISFSSDISSLQQSSNSLSNSSSLSASAHSAQISISSVSSGVSSSSISSSVSSGVSSSSISSSVFHPASVALGLPPSPFSSSVSTTASVLSLPVQKVSATATPSMAQSSAPLPSRPVSAAVSGAKVNASNASSATGPGDALSSTPSASAPVLPVSSPPAKTSSSVAKPTSSAGVKSTSTSAAAKSTSTTGAAKAPASASSAHATSASKGSAVSGTELGPGTFFTGTTTSTITDTPESTLSRTSFIPVTQADGKTSLSAPPLVTILSTSSEANGSFVTFTHVVANPTGFSQAISGDNSHGFFQNSPVVAGVFFLVGVVVVVFVAFGLFFFCRRRRRSRERHRRWLIGVNRPRQLEDEPEYPFQAPRPAPSPPMRDNYNWGIPVRQSLPNSAGHAGLGLYDIPPVRRVQPPQELEEHYDNDMDAGHEPVGLAITTDHDHSGRSSPSIYPPTLPAEKDDPFYEAPQATEVPRPPPRPRRSQLREQGQLITPPSSVSGHSPVSESGSPGPFGLGLPPDSEPVNTWKAPMQLNELMGRRTLLDVRRSQDTTAQRG